MRTGIARRCKIARLGYKDQSTFALVGPTGAGKTTVASLLLRFIEQDAGSITVGGVPLDEIDPAVWRSQVAWVPQNPHLFHGSLAENIRLARPEASAAEMIAAAKAAYLDELYPKPAPGI